MNLSQLKPKEGSIKKAKRVGRGQGSTRGGTSTRGHKGAGSRSGNSKKVGFEGGQMPIQRRLPKYGFKNINRVEYQAVNLSTLQQLADKLGVTSFTIDDFSKYGLSAKTDKIKILGKGTLKSNITVKAHACSDTAKAAIESAGGNIEIIK